jgi:hypothetical protein
MLSSYRQAYSDSAAHNILRRLLVNLFYKKFMLIEVKYFWQMCRETFLDSANVASRRIGRLVFLIIITETVQRYGGF